MKRATAIMPWASCRRFRASHRTIIPSYVDLFAWLEKEGYKIVGNPRAVYIDGIWNQEDSDKRRTFVRRLEAADLGVGTCIVGRFEPKELEKRLNLPSNIHPVLLMPFGYHAEDCVPSPRHTSYRSLDETVEYL